MFLIRALDRKFWLIFKKILKDIYHKIVSDQ